MAYIPGVGWESIVTGQVEPVRGDDRGDPMVSSYYARQSLARSVSALPGAFGVTGMAQTRPAFPAAQPPVIGAIPAVAAAAGVALPAWLLAILGTAAAGYAGYQALGGGEGGGLFGLNVLGGDEFAMGGLEFGGPGLPEPTEPYTEWHVGNKQFYYVKQYTSTGAFKNGKVAMYNKDTKRWKVWTLPKPSLAIIGKNRPSHRMLTRLRRNLSRQTADAKTILKITSPRSLESTRRPGGRWVPGKKRYID
ncbi:hypothetical protein ES703_80765 [subsurface metagenome]